MQKLLDNLHPQNFNRENPGSMLKPWNIHATKNFGYYTVSVHGENDLMQQTIIYTLDNDFNRAAIQANTT